MRHDDLERLRTVLAAAERVLIHDHAVGDLDGDEAGDLYGDAVRYGLVVIRDASVGLSDAARRGDPRIGWQELSELADRLAGADPARVRAVVRAGLPDLVLRLRALIGREEGR